MILSGLGKDPMTHEGAFIVEIEGHKPGMNSFEITEK
jgi:hypothetical protein